jgi:hypothetical protein
MTKVELDMAARFLRKYAERERSAMCGLEEYDDEAVSTDDGGKEDTANKLADKLEMLGLLLMAVESGVLV